MARGTERGRRFAARMLRGLRRQIDPIEPPVEVPLPSAPPEPEVAARPVIAPVELEPEDVQIDAFRLIELMGIGVEALLVDVREPAEVSAQGQVAGAVCIPSGQLGARASELEPQQRIVLYCASGARSTHGAMALRARGYDDAWSLVGGFSAWARAGGEVELLS